MSYTHTYNEVVANPDTLYQSLAFKGVFDAIISVTPTTTYVSTQLGYQYQIDESIEESKEGTLFSNKAAQIKAIQDNSTELAQLGSMFVRPSDVSFQGPLETTGGKRTELRNLISDVDDALVSFPSWTPTSDGRGCQLNSSADVHAAYESVLSRLKYIYGDQLNISDESCGEFAYIIQIIAAQTQGALDAVVDTRS
jgi:hypothetical protein